MRDLQRFNGIAVEKTFGSVWTENGEQIGSLEDFSPRFPLRGETAVPERFTNIQYVSTTAGERTVCVDFRQRKIYPGAGEYFYRPAGIFLIKNLVSSSSYGAKTGDRVVFFSPSEVTGKTFCGKTIGYYGDFTKRISAGQREAIVIESRDELRNLTGILMFSPEGEILFQGGCLNYQAGSKSLFIVRTGKKYVKV